MIHLRNLNTMLIAEARRVEGRLTWCSMPTRLDSLLMRSIAALPNRSTVMACWHLAAMIGAHQPKDQRGNLLDENGKPLDAKGLSLITGWPVEDWTAALRALEDMGEVVIDRAETGTPGHARAETGTPDSKRVRGEENEKKEETPPDGGVQGVSLALTPAAAPTSEGFALALESGTTPTPKKPRKPKPAELPLEEWLASLAANPANKGVDVPREWAKMQMWCEHKGVQPTRRRFIGWLLKADRVEGQGSAPKPRHRPEWLVEKELRETEAELKFLRDQIDYRFGDDLSRLPASLRPRWDRAKAKESSLLDELDAIQNANPAPSRVVL